MPPIPPQLHFPSPYLRPSSAPSIARSIEMADGARIASFVYGARTDATPVLFLHGNGEEHGIFGPAIDVCVEAGHHVVAIDSRGQGKSTLGSTRLTYELMADDALAVLDELGIRRVHIVGFSDGAIEALLIARDHPERVASVLSVGANLTPEGVLEEPDWNLAENVAQLRDWADAGWDSNGGIDPSLLSPTPDEASAAADLLELMLLEPHIPAESLARSAALRRARMRPLHPQAPARHGRLRAAQIDRGIAAHQNTAHPLGMRRTSCSIEAASCGTLDRPGSRPRSGTVPNNHHSCSQSS